MRLSNTFVLITSIPVMLANPLPYDNNFDRTSFESKYDANNVGTDLFNTEPLDESFPPGIEQQADQSSTQQTASFAGESGFTKSKPAFNLQEVQHDSGLDLEAISIKNYPRTFEPNFYSRKCLNCGVFTKSPWVT